MSNLEKEKLQFIENAVNHVNDYYYARKKRPSFIEIQKVKNEIIRWSNLKFEDNFMYYGTINKESLQKVYDSTNFNDEYAVLALVCVAMTCFSILENMSDTNGIIKCSTGLSANPDFMLHNPNRGYSENWDFWTVYTLSGQKIKPDDAQKLIENSETQICFLEWLSMNDETTLKDKLENPKAFASFMSKPELIELRNHYLSSFDFMFS